MAFTTPCQRYERMIDELRYRTQNLLVTASKKRVEWEVVSIWKHSLLASYYSRNVNVKGQCQVRVDGTKIVISYEQHDGPTVYEGEEVAPGHFKLTCARKSGRATLHRIPGENLLEGHWTQGQDQGMWRIQLKDE